MVDLLVLGATGFCGQLITQYLASHPERGSFTFAVGARSKSKLADLRKKFNLDESVVEVVVDVTQPDQVEQAVRDAKVVINTVGPFWRWGTSVVRACARNGVHYVDLSGESHWIRDIIMDFDYLASKTHAIIIPASGFDSLPSDLVVHLANRTLKTLAGPDTQLGASVSAVSLKGAFSGGTLQTLISSLEDVPRHKLEFVRREYALSTGLAGPPGPRPKLIYQLPFASPPVYGGLWVMARTNRAIVQRTWGLNELRARTTKSPEARAHAYGPYFSYEEFMVRPSKFSSLLLSIGLALGMACLLIPPIRWLFKQVAPQSGEGPSEKIQREGFLRLTNVTSSVPTASRRSTHVRTTIRGKGDPGYSLTAVMISESALGLLRSYNELPEHVRQGGIFTPATALGDVIVKRLEATGRMSFEGEVILEEESRKTR